MTIRGVNKAELISLVGDRISDDAFNSILGTHKYSVQEAADNGKLFVTDYKMLSGMDPEAIEGQPFVTDPIAVFAEPNSGNRLLTPVAIQLGQDAVHSELLLANTSDKWRWQMAKTTVQVADCVHQVCVSHLAQTHMVLEAFSVAVQRNLENVHPVSRLLRPHIVGTNFCDRFIAERMFQQGGTIDSVFCNGRGSRLESLKGLLLRGRLGFDFTGRMPDVELKSRNVDKLTVFPYRDDALMIWKALEKWASAYVGLYYENDKTVEVDQQLDAWGRDLVTHAELTNFEIPRTKEVLSRTLAMIMFTASAQHAAVNFSMLEYMTFAPAMTGAAWYSIPPPGHDEIDEQQWLNMFPPLKKAHEQLNLFDLLGGVRYGRLGDYTAGHPPESTLEEKADDALQDFKTELGDIEVAIKARNNQPNQFEYYSLLPSHIPASINI